jgi:hypothetical protein
VRVSVRVSISVGMRVSVSVGMRVSVSVGMRVSVEGECENRIFWNKQNQPMINLSDKF